MTTDSDYCSPLQAKKYHVSGDELPNELLLSIFPLLPLTSLIHARGVNKRWRSLVSQAHLDPSRRSLLQFYYKTILSPAFQKTRTHILPHLQAFNRHSYLSMISLESGPSREFEVWIREWPARATIGWIWPGLEDGMMAQTDEGGGGGGGGGSTSWRVEGVCNCLGHIPPHIKTVTYHQRKSDLSPTNANARLGDEWGERGEGEGVHGGGGGGDAIFHATTFLPIGIELPEHRQGQVEEISWLEEEDEAMMVSIELTTICVGQYASGAGIWLVLDGKRGGEKMKGWVYRGGFGMRPDDIIAKSWIEYLEQELRRAEELVEETKKI